MKLAKQPLLVIFMLTAILWGSSLFPALAQAAEEELPHFYDLRLAVPEDRDSGYDPAKARINAIRNQGIYGTCWAFSAIAAVESNVYTQLQKAGIPYNVQTKPYDLSEWYLAWISAAAPTEVEEDSVYHSRPPEVHNYYRPFAMKVYQGGFPFREVEVMMANGTGLIWEQGETVKNIVAPKKYLPPVLQLKNILMVPEGKAANRAMIKQMIKEYGATSFALNCDPMRQNTFATAFYGSKAGPVNHGIDVIGWDDDFVFTAKNMKDAVIPKQKGAWIIRNSWGDGWNGASLTVSFSDGTPSANLSCNSSSQTEIIEIGNGTHVTLTWRRGDYDHECSFIVKYETGEVIFQVSHPNPGVLHEFDCNCASGQATNTYAPVENLTAEVEIGSITLSWDAPEGAINYIIRRNGIEIDQTIEPIYTDEVFTEFFYTYCIVAEYADGFSIPECIVVKSDLSIEENETVFAIYPNPVNNVLYINGGNTEYSYMMYNSVGQVVANGNAKGTEQISVDGLTKGIYFLRITSGTQVLVEKVVVK